MATADHEGQAGGDASALLERVRELEQGLAEETHRAQALNRIAALISSGRDLDSVVQAVVDGGVELTGASYGAFFYNVLSADGESYALYTLSGAPRSAFENFPMPRNTELFAPTFGGEGIVRSDDITSDRRFGRNAPYNGMPKGHLPVRSYIAVPVVSRSGDVMGGLFFGHPEPGRFRRRHEEVLTGLAAQAAIAIDNVRLNEASERELTERRRAEEALGETQERFRLLADNIPTLCWMAGPDGDIYWYNQRWYEYTGLTEDQMSELGWTTAFQPSDRPEVDRLWRESVDAGEPFEMVYPLRGADSVYRPFLTRVRPERDPVTGEIVRWFGVSTDVARETSTRERLQFALAAGRLGSWELDVETREYLASDLCKINYGREPHEDFGFDDLIASIHPDDQARMRAAIEEAIRTGGNYEIEYRVIMPSTGEVRWVHVRGQAAQTADHGGVRRMAGVSLDVTDRKQAEERQRLLLNELNHRVKNTLATVQSIAGQTLSTAPSPDAFRDAFEARVMALSATHNLLTEGSWEGASLCDIIKAELHPYDPGGQRYGLEVERDIRLNPKAAVAIGMAAHELATNAAKYGALSSPEGRVTVVWWTEGPSDERRLVLQWIESGGPKVKPPTRRGFGGRLLERGLAGELSGQVKLDYAPGGLRCIMTLPLNALEAEA